MPTFFTFVIILGITVLYFNLIPKKVREVEEIIDDKVDEIQIEEEKKVEEVKQEVKSVPKYSMKMKKAELLSIAESLNIDIDKNSKKEEIIKALDNELK